MNVELYRELQEALVERRRKADDKHALIQTFLNALERSAIDAAGQEKEIATYVWGVSKNGDFIAHQYEDTYSGFNFELQVSIFDAKRTALYRNAFPFSATISSTHISVEHADDSRFIPVAEASDGHHHKGVLEMLDESLKSAILKPPAFDISTLTQ